MIYRGARILTVLAIAGRTQTWLRRETRLGAHTIERLLHDPQQTPASATLEAVARTTGVSVAWLDPDDARRELTANETAEVRRCADALLAVARGERTDARSLPNVRAETGRRVPHTFRVHGARQVYRVVGDSLAHAGVLDGDLAYVRPAARLRDVVGSLVVARLNGQLYLERLMVAERGVVLLASAADGLEAIVIGGADRFALLGEVVASVREYRRT